MEITSCVETKTMLICNDFHHFKRPQKKKRKKENYIIILKVKSKMNYFSLEIVGLFLSYVNTEKYFQFC